MATLLPVLILLLLIQESPDEQERIPAVALTADAPYEEVPQVDVLVDESGEWTYHDVTRNSLAALFRQANTPLRFGYSSATYWLRFSVSSGEARPWYLEVGEKSLDHVALFTSIAEFPVLLSGDGHSFHSRPIRHRRLIFPLPDAAEYDVFLRIQSYGPVKPSLRIWDGDALAQATRNEEFALGIFFGILLIMALYHLVLFASLRESRFEKSGPAVRR